MVEQVKSDGLNANDADILLKIVNATNIRGDAAEMIVILKKKLEILALKKA